MDIRELVKELLEDRRLIISYIEFYNGEFDLSVRIDKSLGEQACYMPEEKEQKNDRT